MARTKSKKKFDDGDKIVIKKYANRRLYNTATSSYVTLEHLAEMIKADEDFVVRDAKSGEDITHAVLSQIIFDRESKDENNMLPLPFLRQLISLYGDNMQRMVPGYLQSAMETLTQNQEKMKSAFQDGGGVAGMMPVFEEMTRQNMKFLEQTMSMFNPTSNFDTSSDTGEAEKAAAKKDEEIKALKAQLASLQDKVDALGD